MSSLTQEQPFLFHQLQMLNKLHLAQHPKLLIVCPQLLAEALSRRSTRYKTMLLEDEQEKNETMTKKVEESVQDLETKVKRFPLSKRN